VFIESQSFLVVESMDDFGGELKNERGAWGKEAADEGTLLAGRPAYCRKKNWPTFKRKKIIAQERTS